MFLFAASCYLRAACWAGLILAVKYATKGLIPGESRWGEENKRRETILGNPGFNILGILAHFRAL
jgi:hypothetical protein